jgi:hypothetical protein
MVDDIAALRPGGIDTEVTLARLEQLSREPTTMDDDAPIFVAAVGWRSGSTLVQRSLMTDEDVLIWGEPLGQLAFLDRLLEPLGAITGGWPPDDHWLSHRAEVDLVRDWVANLGPDPAHLKAAYRAFFDTWLAAPARSQGFRRWGVKEVRWTGRHAALLRWLYPKAHFLLLVRHPLTAYLSLRNFGLEPPEHGFLDRWPDRWILDADTWGRFWNEGAVSWVAVADHLKATVIRYEDLVAGRIDLREVGRRLDLQIDPEAAAATRVGGPVFDKQLTDHEIGRILELTASGRHLFAYGD